MKTGIFWQSYTSIVLAAKNYLTQAWSLNVLFLMFAPAILAQSRGALKIEVFDSSEEALPFANISVYKNNIQKAGGISDLDGAAFIKPLEADTYHVRVTYAGCQTRQVNKVVVTANRTARVRVNLLMLGTTMLDMVITEYRAPANVDVTDTEDFQKMAVKNIDSVICGGGCIYQAGPGSAIIRDGRGRTCRIFIDGERAIGTPLTGDPVPAIFAPPVPGGLSAQYENARVEAGAIFPNR